MRTIPVLVVGLSVLTATLGLACPDPVYANIVAFDGGITVGVTVVRYDGAHTTSASVGGGSGTYGVRWRGIMPYLTAFWAAQTPPITTEALGGTKPVNASANTVHQWAGAFVADTEVKVKVRDSVGPGAWSAWDVLDVAVNDRDWTDNPAPEPPTLGSPDWNINVVPDPNGNGHDIGDHLPNPWFAAPSTHKVNDDGPNDQVRFVEDLKNTYYKASYVLHGQMLSDPLGDFGLAQNGAPQGEISLGQLIAWTSRHEALGTLKTTSHQAVMEDLLSQEVYSPSQAAEGCLSLTKSGIHYINDGSTIPMGGSAFQSTVQAYMNHIWTQAFMPAYNNIQVAPINVPVDASGNWSQDNAEEIDYVPYWFPNP